MNMQTSGPLTALEDPQLSARRIFSLIASEMAEVEAEFERQAQSNIQVIAYISTTCALRAASVYVRR